MGHMQHEITLKQTGWMVETNEGTSYVPGDVVSASAIRPGVVLDATTDGLIFEACCELLRDYVTGRDIQSIEAIEGRYFARLSAPGYLDCTDWCAFKTLKEARDYLRDI